MTRDRIGSPTSIICTKKTRKELSGSILVPEKKEWILELLKDTRCSMSAKNIQEALSQKKRFLTNGEVQDSVRFLVKDGLVYSVNPGVFKFKGR